MIFDHEHNTENSYFSKPTDRPDTSFDKTVLTEAFGSLFGPNFVLWSPFNNDERWRKASVSPTGLKTSHLDSDHNYTLESALTLATAACSGVGVSLGKDGLVRSVNDGGTALYLHCLDLDGFADVSAGLTDDGVAELLDLLGTYTEISPSGTGLKCFFLSETEPQKKLVIPFGRSEFAARYPDVKKYQNRQIEIFSKGFYLTLTGDLLNDSECLSRLVILDNEKVQQVYDYLYGWAALHVPTEHIGSTGTAVPQLPSTNEGYSKLTISSLELVLSHIDPVFENDWSDTANALARVYGEAGRSIFHRYSSGTLQNRSVDMYDEEDSDARYTRALRELESRPVGLGCKSLVMKAMRSPSWDATMDVVYEDDQSALSNKPINSSSIVREHIGDIANGKRFAALVKGRILYLTDTRNYLEFSESSGWVGCKAPIVSALAKDVVAAMRLEWARRSHENPDSSAVKNLITEMKRASSKPGLDAMIELGRQESGVWATSSDFDQESLLLGLQNGILNLATHELLKPRPDLKISKRCPVSYDADAACPIFGKYLARVIPNLDVRIFLQKYIGYLLSGDTSEHIFAFLYGHGRNGKTVFVELLAWLLGDYAVKLQTEMLMQQTRSTQAASPDLAKLRGARFAYCTETAEGRQLNDSKIKELTGGDTIACRPLWSDEISFKPTHKLLMVGNYKPRITDNSEGMWRRMTLIPFEQTLSDAEIDPKLPEKLKVEAAGILNWAIEGFDLWQQEGLQRPVQLSKATDEYRTSEDTLNEWLHECCDMNSSAKCMKSELYDSYANWCRSNGHQPLKSNEFGRKLTALGYNLAADNRHRLGLELTSQTQNFELLLMDNGD